MYFYCYFILRFLDKYKLCCNNIIDTSVFCPSKWTTQPNSQCHFCFIMWGICCGILMFFLCQDRYFGLGKWHYPSRGTVTWTYRDSEVFTWEESCWMINSNRDFFFYSYLNTIVIASVLLLRFIYWRKHWGIASFWSFHRKIQILFSCALYTGYQLRLMLGGDF